MNYDVSIQRNTLQLSQSGDVFYMKIWKASLIYCYLEKAEFKTECIVKYFWGKSGRRLKYMFVFGIFA